jgi:hypothetical protein
MQKFIADSNLPESQSLLKMSVFTLRYLLFVANLSKFNDLSNLDKP